jgi:hypothetical protein
MTITLDGTTGITSPNDTTGNQSYTGTLTGGTGVVNLGSGQFYKDASGNVGIGTASPTTKFQVSGAASTNATSRFVAKFTDTSAVATGNGGGIMFQGVYTGTTALDCSGIQAYKENATDGNYSYAMTFATRANSGDLTERMRIDSSGNLLVGTTTNPNTAKLRVYKSGDNIIETETDNAGGGYIHHGFLNPNGRVGYISTGSSSTIYSTTSDYRLKENIAPMTGALDKVAQLKPVTYNWKADGSAGEGFIAHELQTVVPNAVTGEKDGEQMQGIDTSFLVATLTAAIQELNAKFEAYKASHP